MVDVLSRPKDLHKQACEERSHYYTGACIREAIYEIERLRRFLERVKGEAMNRDADPMDAFDAIRAECEFLEIK